MPPKEYILFVKSKPDDIAVSRLVLAAGLDCEIIGSTTDELGLDETPILSGRRDYIGLEEIRNHIEALGLL